MMAKTTEEKIAELSVLVNDLKQKFPLMEHSISEISNTLTREQMNIGMLTKQYDKLYEIVEDFKEIQYSVQKLNDDSKRFAEQIESGRKTLKNCQGFCIAGILPPQSSI
jgi:uncharacterized coiled-coil protein SlyX